MEELAEFCGPGIVHGGGREAVYERWVNTAFLSGESRQALGRNAVPSDPTYSYVANK
jgi:hypothetical protein